MQGTNPGIFWSMAAVSVASTALAMMDDFPVPGPPSRISGTSCPLPSTYSWIYKHAAVV